MPTYLHARRGSFEAGLSLPTEELAVDVALWLAAHGWEAEVREVAPRLTLAEKEASIAIFREYMGSRGR
jgi:hypothetical protein